jgi:hypothetical protein
MPTNVQNQQVMRASTGFCVQRAAAALPSSTIGTIFNINGGRVLIKSITGMVVTLLSGTNSTSIGVTPTSTGTSAPTALCTAGIIPVAAGSPLTGVLGGALLVTVPGGLIAATPFHAVIGAVTITPASTTTGTVSWDLIYVPIDPGASVTAA